MPQTEEKTDQMEPETVSAGIGTGPGAAGGFLTVQEAAERKGVAASAIYRAISDGRLPSQKVLGRTALSVADVDAYEPGSYGGVQRTVRRRGPGRGPGRARKDEAGE